MYIPSFHSIVRGGGEIPLNMISLPFMPLMDLDNSKVEEIWPEYTDGGYYKSDGTLNASDDYAYAEVDVSKYKYVYIPAICVTNVTVLSGLRATQGSGSLAGKCIFYRSGSLNISSSYALFEVDATPYACISVGANMHLPLIGVVED